ncbi:hypothetical protein OIV38_31030, partial [Burkholderia pseudomallei]|nr:hypothetical protein [Burkholderia pseudomallei]
LRLGDGQAVPVGGIQRSRFLRRLPDVAVACAEREGVRFIQVFEMEVLKSYFTQVRNQFGHGPGTQPMPNFTAEQTDWAIEFAMSWIRTLVRRLKLSE